MFTIIVVMTIFVQKNMMMQIFVEPQQQNVMKCEKSNTMPAVGMAPEVDAVSVGTLLINAHGICVEITL